MVNSKLEENGLMMMTWFPQNSPHDSQRLEVGQNDHLVLNTSEMLHGHTVNCEKGVAAVTLSMKCLYVTGGLFHVEVEIRVHSKKLLEGQYFTSIGTQGNLS